jgi:hypothetical protein
VNYWYEILEDGALVVVSILLGMLLMSIIKRHFKKHDPFVPQIPFVRPGTPVMIGDDLYVLMEYHYADVHDDPQGERTVILKSVHQNEKEFSPYE